MSKRTSTKNARPTGSVLVYTTRSPLRGENLARIHRVARISGVK